MNYSEALAWLYGTQLHGIKLGLENIQRLLDVLGWNGHSQRFIHVAGTNGKGSVCAMLDAICRAQGIRTGLFTSPHLVTFRERIRINGEMISEQKVANGLTKIRDLIATDWETHPTFFEITTALTLDFFQQENADVAVLETGMGGRLDATNAVTPRVCVITAIDLDHQQWLGSTLREIAAEKAGIIKPGVPVIISRQSEESEQVLCQTARERNAACERVNRADEPFEIALAGSHQKLNAALAVAALRIGEIGVSRSAIESGLRNVRWQGRFQRIGSGIVLDGAHNPAAAARLADTWREVFEHEKATIILGILRDKNIADICAALAPIAARFIATPVQNPRTSSTAEICAAIAPYHLQCVSAKNLPDALQLAQSQTSRILITGSLFLVGEALAHFGEADSAPEISSQ